MKKMQSMKRTVMSVVESLLQTSIRGHKHRADLHIQAEVMLNEVLEDEQLRGSTRVKLNKLKMLLYTNRMREKMMGEMIKLDQKQVGQLSLLLDAFEGINTSLSVDENQLN